MATYTNTVRDPSLATSIAGTMADGDTVLLTQGYDQYTAGLSNPTIDLAKFHATPGFMGDIASSALDLETTLGILEWSGQVIRITSTGGTFTWDELQVNPARGGQVEASSITITLLYQNAGTFLAADSATVTTLTQMGGQSEYDKGGTAITTATVQGGSMKLKRDIGTLNLQGTGVCEVDSSTCSPTTINMQGGTFRVNGLCGNIGTLTGTSGVVDLSMLANDITISTRSLGPGVWIKMPLGGAVVTVTTTSNIGSGPRFG